MIEHTGTSMTVEELMERVRAEAAAIRAAGPRSETSPFVPAALFEQLRYQPNDAAWVQVSAYLDDAEKNAQPRSSIPRRFQSGALAVFRPLLRFMLRVNNYAFKDQRHVNLSTEAALREITKQGRAHGEEMQRLFSALRILADLVHEIEARASRSDVDGRLTEVEARMAPIEAIAESLRDVGERYAAFERRTADRLDALEAAMTANAERIELLERAAPVARLLALENAMSTNASRIDTLEHLQLSDRLPGFRTEIAELREHMLRADATIRADLLAQQQVVGRVLAGSSSGGPVAVPTAATVKSYENVLLELADRFRGDPSTIARRHEQYLGIVRVAGCVDDAHPLVDVGAGRGEWLRILRDNGIAHRGIELSETLVARGREDGFEIEHADAITALRSYTAGSVGAVTGFHIIEHFSFEQAIDFLDECLRVLRPNGALILETPRPANIMVGACNFWLDPTHVHPIPEQLATFLLENRGFGDVKVMLLTPNTSARVDALDPAATRLNEVLYGPQEYAVLARRPG